MAGKSPKDTALLLKESEQTLSELANQLFTSDDKYMNFVRYKLYSMAYAVCRSHGVDITEVPRLVWEAARYVSKSWDPKLGKSWEGYLLAWVHLNVLDTIEVEFLGRLKRGRGEVLHPERELTSGLLLEEVEDYRDSDELELGEIKSLVESLSEKERDSIFFSSKRWRKKYKTTRQMQSLIRVKTFRKLRELVHAKGLDIDDFVKQEKRGMLL